jgi:hypothetical protein
LLQAITVDYSDYINVIVYWDKNFFSAPPPTALVNTHMPLITTDVISTTTVADINNTSTLFLSLVLTGTTPWPEPADYLPGLFSRPALAHSSGTLVDSVSEPIGVIAQAKWYLKWLRCPIDDSWARIYWLPPGASTLPTLDVQENFVSGVKTPAAWTLFISRPDNADVQVCAWTTTSNTEIVGSRGLFRYSTTMAVGSCQTQNFPTFDTAQAELTEAWSLANTSCVYPTGYNWFNLVNTGSTTATVVTISSTSPAGLDQLLHAPQTQPRSMWGYTW